MTSEVACICTAIAGRMIPLMNGMNFLATFPRMTRGSSDPSADDSASMKSGTVTPRVLIAA